MGAFHAYDIRGVYNVDFDKDVAYKVGYFLPELLSADKVLVGRDARVSPPEIHDYLLKGIVDAGADVYDFGPVSWFRTSGDDEQAPRVKLIIPPSNANRIFIMAPVSYQS